MCIHCTSTLVYFVFGYFKIFGMYYQNVDGKRVFVFGTQAYYFYRGYRYIFWLGYGDSRLTPSLDSHYNFYTV